MKAPTESELAGARVFVQRPGVQVPIDAEWHVLVDGRVLVRYPSGGWMTSMYDAAATKIISITEKPRSPARVIIRQHRSNGGATGCDRRKRVKSSRAMTYQPFGARFRHVRVRRFGTFDDDLVAGLV